MCQCALWTCSCKPKPHPQQQQQPQKSAESSDEFLFRRRNDVFDIMEWVAERVPPRLGAPDENKIRGKSAYEKKEEDKKEQTNTHHITHWMVAT